MAAAGVAGAVAALGGVRAGDVKITAVGGGGFGVQLVGGAQQHHGFGVDAQGLAVRGGVARFGAFVKRQQADALLRGVQVAGDAADGLAGFLQLLLFQVKLKTGAAVPRAAVGPNAGRRWLRKHAGVQAKAHAYE